jgi:hypothetical protein
MNMAPDMEFGIPRLTFAFPASQFEGSYNLNASLTEVQDALLQANGACIREAEVKERVSRADGLAPRACIVQHGYRPVRKCIRS